MKDEEKLEKYENCLFEIKNRIIVIEEHLNGICNEKYKITEVEFLCLQFRKILEKIAMASLVANQKEYSKVNDKFSKDYNARLILRDLERVNVDFYPVPNIKKIVEKTSDGKSVFETLDIKEGFLTKKELLLIYEKCGGMLHSINPYSPKKDLEEYQNNFSQWLTKIVLLMNHHYIKLCDGTILAAMLKRDDNGNPQAVLFAPAGNNTLKVI